MIKTFSVSQEPNFFVPTENILDEPMSAFPLKADISECLKWMRVTDLFYTKLQIHI